MKSLFLILLFSTAFYTAHAQRGASLDPFDRRNQVEDQSEIRKGETIEEKIRKNFFLKAEVNKTTCYVGEPLMATFKAYSRLNASSKVLKRPALTGFSVLEMVDAYNSEPDIERLKGKSYYAHLIRKVQLFSLQAGTFTLDPAEVESDIYFYKHVRNPDRNRRFRDIFGNRHNEESGDSVIVKKILLETPTLEVQVNPLPEDGQPEDFSGAVGKFSIELQMNEKNLGQFEPATVKLLVLGTGNFPLVTDPAITWPKGVQVSGPQVTEELNKYVYPLSGTKIFQYSLDTRDTGMFTIPTVHFSYFDPAEKKYKTAATAPIVYTVSVGVKEAAKAAEEKIVHHSVDFPIQYLYFGLIVLGILGWIVYQVFRGRKRGNAGE